MSETRGDGVATAPETWGRQTRTVGCTSCGTTFLQAAGPPLERCRACLDDALEVQEGDGDALKPERVLPFAVDETALRKRLAAWCSRCPFPPDELAVDRLLRNARRVFVPVWLTDVTVRAGWGAEAGHDYQVASTREIYRQGGWQTQHIEETRVRWEPRAGTLERRYDNRGAPALESFGALTQRIGAFDLAHTEAWDPRRLDDAAAVQFPDRSSDDAWPDVEPGVRRLAARDIQAACSAQHLRDIRLDASFDDLHWTLLLLPVISTWYRDEAGLPVPVDVHGVTGNVRGDLRPSMRKAKRLAIRLGAAAGLSILAGLLIRAFHPIGIAGILAGMGLAVAALAPLLRVSAFRQRSSR